MTKTGSPPAKIIYIFNSVPPDRPPYKRGVLDALCYPHGHTMVMSYGKKYIQPALLQKRPGLAARKAYFVFLERTSGGQEHTFFPIRQAKILECSPDPRDAGFAHANRAELRVELGRFIEYDSGHDTAIKSIPEHPVPPASGKRPGDYYFVLEGDDIIRSTTQKAPPDVWEGLVEKVAGAESLTGCVFVSVTHLRQFGQREECDLETYQGRDKAYSLRPASVYEMDLRVFDRGAAKTAQLTVKSSSDLLVVTRPFPTVVGGLGTHRVVISCKRSIESTVAVLSVERSDQARSPSSGQTAACSGQIDAAQPLYHVVLAPPKTVLTGFVVLVFFGALLTSTSVDFFSEYPVTACWAQSWALASKMTGAGLLTAAAWLGFRRLPSGSP